MLRRTRRLLPVSGSTYIYATLGELAAWIIGWDLILGYAVGSVTAAVGWSGYSVGLLASLGIQIPKALAVAPCNLPAAAIVPVLSGLLIGGTRNQRD